MAENENSENSSTGQPVIKFTYTKSSAFRVIRADGAWGTVSPRGDIIMSLFSERMPFPDTESYAVNEGGNLQLKDQHRSSEGILREIEVAVNMDPLTAFNVMKWLERKIAQTEKQLGMHFQLNKDGAVEVISYNEEGGANEIQTELES